MSPTGYGIFLLCVTLACYIQNLTGFAFGLVLLGLTGVLHLGNIPDMTNVVSVLVLVNAVVLFSSQRPSFERAVLAPTLLMSLVGVLLGALLLNWLSDNILVALRLLLGLTILACAGVLLLPASALKQRSGTASFAGFGLLGGLLGGLFSTAGPPLVFHFYRQPFAPRQIREALVLIFAVNAVLRLSLMVADGRVALNVLWLSLLAAPVVLVQTRWMAGRPPRWDAATVKRIVAGLLAAIGLGLAGPAGRSLFS
jgi:uncharacterized protein